MKIGIGAATAVVIGVLATASPALAAELDDTVLAVASRLGYQEGEVEYGASKIWPADRKVTLVALAVLAEGNDDVSIYNLDVLTTDTKSGKVLARHRQKKAITSDAVRLTSISIDTAPYRLSDQVRAFGVRMGYVGSSSINPYSADVLSLYVVSGKHIARVAGPLIMSSSNGDWDQECEGTFTDISRTLALGATSTAGYRDLTVSGSQTDRVVQRGKSGGKCDESEKTQPSLTYGLKYDGSAYSLPKELAWK